MFGERILAAAFFFPPFLSFGGVSASPSPLGGAGFAAFFFFGAVIGSWRYIRRRISEAGERERGGEGEGRGERGRGEGRGRGGAESTRVAPAGLLKSPSSVTHDLAPPRPVKPPDIPTPRDRALLLWSICFCTKRYVNQFVKSYASRCVNQYVNRYENRMV